MKTLVVNTSNADLLMKLISGMMGEVFYAPLGGGVYKVCYYAHARRIHFEGKLSDEQLEEVKAAGHMVNRIEIDDLRDEIRIEDMQETTEQPSLCSPHKN